MSCLKINYAVAVVGVYRAMYMMLMQHVVCGLFYLDALAIDAFISVFAYNVCVLMTHKNANLFPQLNDLKQFSNVKKSFV